MTSKTVEGFWRSFELLPRDVQQQAQERFALWKKDAFHSALHFKALSCDVWSIRVNQQYRALGRRKGSLIVWFWIGSHSEYNALIKRLQ